MESLAERIQQRRCELPELRQITLDSDLAAITGTLDGEEIFLWNEIHLCKGMRKLHLEIAILGSGLQILHCVFFPDPNFDLPIFGTDVVVGSAGVSAAIVDLSPVTGILPNELTLQLEKLSIPSFKQVRDLPSWGSIFSPYVKFIRPANRFEESCFLELVDDYLSCLLAELYRSSADRLDTTSTMNRYKGQLNYCNQQKRNDKTRRILKKAFGTQWAERYIEEVLFDMPLAP